MIWINSDGYSSVQLFVVYMGTLYLLPSRDYLAQITKYARNGENYRTLGENFILQNLENVIYASNPYNQ